jgi:hypothetical protein
MTEVLFYRYDVESNEFYAEAHEDLTERQHLDIIEESVESAFDEVLSPEQKGVGECWEILLTGRGRTLWDAAEEVCQSADEGIDRLFSESGYIEMAWVEQMSVKPCYLDGAPGFVVSGRIRAWGC